MIRVLCCRFKEIAEFVVQSLDPPRYEAPRTCAYCSSEHAPDAYQAHLVAAHADYLFHCDECDTYVDRKDFILHMSLHAVEYAAKQDKKEPIKRVKKVKKRKSEAKDENENNEKGPKCNKRVKSDSDGKSTDVRKSTDSASDPQNEFSDHSDTEYGFGPLPESVFEAIEDSQDSQPANENEVSSQVEENEDQPNDRSDISTESIETDQAPKPAENTVKSHRKSRTCPICGKVYTASSSYFYHMKHFHKRSKDHECDVCGKKFGTKACLVQHKAIHTGECRYECKECGKRFRSKASLYIHEQTHNGVKSWSCSQCHRSFRWRTHLARHMKRHAAEKGHVCATCGRGFSVRCDLLRHARTHAAGDHACTKCGLKFAQLRYLKVHMDRKHAVTGEKPVNGQI